MVSINGSQTIQVKLAAAVTTNQLTVVASFDEYSNPQKPAEDVSGSIVSQTNDDQFVVVMPSNEIYSRIRKVKYFSINNRDTVSATLSIVFFNDTTPFPISTWTLDPGDTCFYEEGQGWKTINSLGELKVPTAPAPTYPTQLVPFTDVSMLLKDVGDSITLSTSTTADLDYSATFVDSIPATPTHAPDASVGKIAAIGAATTIVSAPAVNVKRQINGITIRNIHAATSNVISVSKVASAVSYKLTPEITLLAGESLQYRIDGSWAYYAADGSIKAQQTAAGISTWIQYNSNGFLAANSNFTYDAATNTFSLIGTDPLFLLNGVTTEPGAPASGQLYLYQSQIGGKNLPKFKGIMGNPEFMQSALWYGHITDWISGIAAGTGRGGTFTNAGTNTLVAPSATNLYTQMYRSSFANVITTANQQVGIRSGNAFWLNLQFSTKSIP